MTLDFVSEYIHNYGYFVVFAVLFIAMIGIPAPEETFMLLIGGMLLDSGLTFFQVIVIALLGTNSAMLVTYLAGRKLGNRLVSRYGHKFHITPAKWEKMKQDLEKYDGIATVCTYFLPGVRQVVPYLSGTRKVPYLSCFSSFYVYRQSFMVRLLYGRWLLLRECAWTCLFSELCVSGELVVRGCLYFQVDHKEQG